MKKLLTLLMCMMLLFSCAWAETASVETVIVLSDDAITVNGAAITEDDTADVYLSHQVEIHPDVPEELAGISNRVITITDEGAYRISGTASDVQIAVKAEAADKVRIILDGADITCRTAPAIVGHSAYDPRTANEYGLVIELAEGSENFVTGSHTARINDDDVKFDGAIDSLVSLGFEGSGSLTVNADNEGIEVKYGHMTINGGTFHITSGDDPLNVSEDGIGTLTVNDGYLFSSVRPDQGGEGDGIDSNGYIVFNGGTVINLAHPSSQDSGIDSDMGSSINGGIIVGAGNMYDPIESNSEQLFMMLEFGQETDDLVVVTDADGKPIFAYDFPYDYMYIAFSTPELKDGVYHVYLGGEIEGEQQDGLYTSITSYTPGTLMQHGEGTAQQRTNVPAGMGGMQQPAGDMMGMGGMQQPAGDMMGMGGMQQPAGDMMSMSGMQQFGGDMAGMGDMQQFGGDMAGMGGMVMDGTADMAAIYEAYIQGMNKLDLNEVLADEDLNELLSGIDLNDLLTGLSITDLLTDEQIKEYFGDIDPEMLDMISEISSGFGNRMIGNPRGLESSSDTATVDFVLSRESTGFTNIVAAN